MNETHAIRRLAFTLLLVMAASAEAQHVSGIVSDERGRAVSQAEVIIRDSTESVAALLRTTLDGAYAARLRRPGTYSITVRRLGYVPPDARTVIVAAETPQIVNITIARATIELSPVVVRAQRDSIRATKIFGMDLRTVAGTIITPAEFEMKAIGATGLVDVVRSSAPWVNRTSTGGNNECVGYNRTGGRFNQGPPCLLVFLNNLRIDPATVNEAVPLNAVDYVVLLRPVDATTIFGTGAQNGVMLIYTKTKR